MSNETSNSPENFEQCLQQLESIVKTMEQGNLNLEEALSSFEQGISMIRKCQTTLQAAAQKVELLTSKQDTVPFTPDED